MAAAIVGARLPRPARFLASPDTYNGSDSSPLRYQSLTTTGVQVKVEEDTTYDAETGHSAEGVHYLTIQGNGTLAATAPEVEIKYYSFNGQRVVMRQDGVVYYLLGDHPRFREGRFWAARAWLLMPTGSR